MPITELKAKNFKWINITGAKDLLGPEIKYLKTNFNFHQINLKDCVIDGQRQKIDEHKEHFFIVLLYPVFNRKTREIEPVEIDFFISKNYIITVHNNKLVPILQFFNHLKKDKYKREREELLSNNVIVILYNVLNRLICHCFPMLDHISRDIHNIERQMFGGQEMEMAKEILITRRNIVDFRKIMQTHKNIMKKIEKANSRLNLFEMEKADIYLNNLIESSKEIWDFLDSFKESIEALHGTNESLLSYRLNQIMKTFTSISVIIFLLTLVGTLFGIQAKQTPFIHWPFGFWIILLIEIITGFIFYSFFKRKKWF